MEGMEGEDVSERVDASIHISHTTHHASLITHHFSRFTP